MDVEYTIMLWHILELLLRRVCTIIQLAGQKRLVVLIPSICTSMLDNA